MIYERCSSLGSEFLFEFFVWAFGSHLWLELLLVFFVGVFGSNFWVEFLVGVFGSAFFAIQNKGGKNPALRVPPGGNQVDGLPPAYSS